MSNHLIYTLTTNPALDLSGHVSKIVPNEKNYVQKMRFDPGGNAINAARIAKRMGLEPTLLGFLGGAAGEQLKTLLDGEKLKRRFTPIQGITRTNVTITNDEDHQQTRLTFPGPRVRGIEIHALLQTIRKLKSPGIIILGGSSPGHCSLDFNLRLIRAALSQNLGVIVDVPVPDLKIILKANLRKLLLIKPNQVEFEGLMGKKFSTDLEIAKEAYKLRNKSELVCISLGQRGAILAWKGRAWFVRSPRIRCLGTVGAGDSMVGAMATRLAQCGYTRPELCLEAKPIIDALKWGVAAGAATAQTEGTSLGKFLTIQKLFPKSRVQQIWGEKINE